MQDGKWFSTTYFNENLNGGSSNINVVFGETAQVSFINNSDVLNEMKVFYNEIKNGKYLDIIGEDKYYEISSMTCDEFIKRIINIAQPKQGDLCRICVSIKADGNYLEYVYFEMP